LTRLPHGVALLVGVACLWPGGAAAEDLFKTGFETPYLVGPLLGQQGWQTLSSPATTITQWQVVNTRRSEGILSATFNTKPVGGSHWAWQPLNFVPSAEFEVLEVATKWYVLFDDASVNPSLFGLECYPLPGEGGRIAFAHLNGLGEVRLVAGTQNQTAVTRAVRNAWNELTLRLDFRTLTARVKLNGLDLALSAPITAPSVGEADLRASALGFDTGWADEMVVRRLPWRVPLTGRVTLQDWTGAVFDRPVTVNLREAIGTGEETLTVKLDGQGNFTAETKLLGGLNVRVKGDRWLTGLQNVTTTAAGGLMAPISLVNGDIDNDNAVTVFDFDALSRFFDKASTDTDWLTTDFGGIAPANADLDGDDSVTVFDYDILSRNFDREGA